MTMKLPGKVLHAFFILIFFSGSLFSQQQLSAFKDKIDFYVLDNFTKMGGNDTVFVSNAYNDSGDDSNDFYFYNSKNKQKIFPYGFEMAYPFVGKTAVVKYKNRWGLIDRSGRFIFYSISPYPIKLTSYEKFAIFDNTVKYDLRDGTFYENSIYCAMPATPDYFISHTESGKYNVIDRKRQPIFKTEMDSIVSKQEYLYKENENQNLLIVKKKNKYGLYLANGYKILKIQYEKARFVGNYIMLFENNTWNYYTYENDRLNLILSTPFECVTSAYQPKVMGVIKKDDQYNLLKMNGETLPENFDYISKDGTYGVKGNTLVIFDAEANYYTYAEK
ncbi:MAG: hypothetical protein P0Y62_16960 [Candidatus Chryseobacterium colombiense]|nr:hypothetical protein [Chryseobacterium sp.]WEK69513.1 MAG: hypothetical protein P0Y62_16960 [Chryseobacterium sp.]